MSETSNAGANSKLLLALAISLAINCLGLGYVIGHGAASFPALSPQATVASSSGSFGERIKHLPKEERQKFQHVMHASQPAIRQARQDLVEAKARLNQALVSEPYDSERVRLAFADIRAKTETLQSRVQDVTALALAELSAESRRQLAVP